MPLKAGSNGYTPLAEAVAAQLREDILSGALQAGQRITQAAVAQRSGTSRIPVREAMQMLEAEGLLNLIPHSEARVVHLDLQELRELYLLRERLEPLALELSISSHAGIDISGLCQLINEMESTSSGGLKPNNIGRFLELDRQFHVKSCSAAPKRLTRQVETLLNASQPYRRKYLTLIDQPRRMDLTNTEHRLLLDAIEHRDADIGGRILAVHIRRTRLNLDDRRLTPSPT